MVTQAGRQGEAVKQVFRAKEEGGQDEAGRARRAGRQGDAGRQGEARRQGEAGSYACDAVKQSTGRASKSGRSS